MPKFRSENQEKVRYEIKAITRMKMLDFSLILQFTRKTVVNKMIVKTKIILLLQKFGTKMNHHKKVPTMAQIVQIADILPAVLPAVCKFSSFSFKIMGLIVPIQKDGMKNIKIVLIIAHILTLDIFEAMFVNMNFWKNGIRNIIRAVSIRIIFNFFSLSFLSAISHPR